MQKAPKTQQIFTKLAQNSGFLEKLPKTGNWSIFRVPSSKILHFCKFVPEAQENFATFSLKYGLRAIQNGSRRAAGGGG